MLKNLNIFVVRDSLESTESVQIKIQVYEWSSLTPVLEDVIDATIVSLFAYTRKPMLITTMILILGTKFSKIDQINSTRITVDNANRKSIY